LAKKRRPLPADYSTLDWDDTNALDTWLWSHGYKGGVMSGFRRWAFVQFSVEDLLDLAIIPDWYPQESSQRLRELVQIDDLDHRTTTPPQPWLERHLRGEFAAEFPIICRPTTRMNRRHRAKLWIEDGAGRTVVYLRAILRLGIESQMRGYVGFDPDPKSSYLQTKFKGEFAKNASKLSTLEGAINAAKPSLTEQIGHLLGRARGRWV
jgi:hypothetical protein